MVYFYHHYELQTVLQRAERFQRLIQRQQQRRRRQRHQPTGGGSYRPEGRSPVEVTIRLVQNFNLVNGLNNLGRLGAVLLLRLRVRTASATNYPTGHVSTASGDVFIVTESAGT